MSEEQPNKHSARKRMKRIFVGIISGALLLAVILELSMLFFAEFIFRNTVQNFVRSESKGVYEMSFEDLSIEPVTGYIYIKNFRLDSDSLRYNELTEQGTIRTSLYGISLTELKLEGLNVLDLLMYRNLNIDALTLKEPNFRILKVPERLPDDTRKIKILKHDLYQLVKPYFNSVKISRFDLEQGFFSLNAGENRLMKQTGAERISFNIKGFVVDSVEYKKQENLFYSREIMLRISNYSLKLNDGVHEVIVGNVLLNPTDSVALVDDAVLRPISRLSQSPQKGMVSNLSVEQLKISGIDLFEAWNNKNVKLRHIQLYKPIIQMRSYSSMQSDSAISGKFSRNNDFYKLIEGSLNSLSFDTLSIKNAAFSFYKGDERIPSYDIRDFNLTTAGFLLDSLAHARTEKLLFSDDIEMAFSKLKFSVMNRSHFLQADSLYASVGNRELYLSGLRLFPTGQTAGGKPGLDIRLSQMRFSDMDFIKAFNEGYLKIGSIRLISPEIDITARGEPKSKRMDAEIAYYLVSDFVHTLRVNNIRVTDADFAFRHHFPDEKEAFYTAGFDLNLNGLLIDRATLLQSNSLLFADRFNLTMTNFSMKTPDDLHRLKLDSLNVSSSDSLIFMKGFSYSPYKSSNHAAVLRRYGKSFISDIFIEQLELSGFDLKRAIYQKNYSADKLLLKDFNLFMRVYPQLKDRKPEKKAFYFQKLVLEDTLHNPIEPEAESLKSFRQQLGESVYLALNELFERNLSALHVRTLQLGNGYFYYANVDTSEAVENYTEGRISTTASDICFNDSVFTNEQMPISGVLDFSVRDFKHFNQNKNLNIKAAYLKYMSADSAFHIEQFRFQPADRTMADSTQTLFFLMAPVIDLQGLGIDALLKEKHLHLNALNIPKVYLDVELPAKSKVRDANQFRAFRLPDSLSGLQFDFLGIREGRLAIRPFGGDTAIGQAHFSFDAEDIKDDPGNYSFPLQYRKAVLSLHDAFYRMPDSVNVAMVDSVYFSMHKNYLYSENISYSPDSIIQIPNTLGTNRKKENTFTANAEILEIKGLNILNLAFDRYFNPAQINLTNLRLNYTRFRKSDKQQNTLSVGALEQKIKHGILKSFVRFRIGDFNLRNASLEYIDLSKPKTDTLVLKNIYSEIRNFDPDRDPADSVLFFSDDVRLSIRHFSKVLPDGMYRFSFQEAGLSLKEKRAYLYKGRLTPMYGKYAFAQHIGKQKTRLDIDNANLDIKDIDFRTLIDSQAVYAGQAKVSELTLNAFKDKHLPEDTMRRPPSFIELLQSVENDINIEELVVEDVNINFEQNSEEYAKTGRISFNELNGTISNITNVDSLIAKNHFLRARLAAKIQNEADMRVSFRFPLDTAGSYMFVGLVDTFDLYSLNRFTENTILLSVEEGRSNKISFHVTVYDDYAEGKMHFFYNDLRISLLDTASSKRSFTSAIANAVLPSDNPKNRFSKLRDGTIYATDLPYKGEFFLWAKAILSGALSSVSLEPDEVKAHKKFKRKLQRVLDKEKRRNARRIRKEEDRLREEMKNKDDSLEYN